MVGSDSEDYVSAMVIDRQGDVGIGVTNPQVPFHVRGETKFKIADGESVVIETAADNNLRIDSEGKLFINPVGDIPMYGEE